MLPPDHDGVYIGGKRNKGKSTLLEQLKSNQPRVVLYDAKGEQTEPVRLVAGSPYAHLQHTGVLRLYVPRGLHPLYELEYAAHVAIYAGNCVFIVDELPDALEDVKRPEDVPNFTYITRLGRKRGVRFIYVSQRPADVPRMATSQAADWYLFQTNEPSELDYINRAMGPRARDIVRELPRGSSLHVKDGEAVGIMETVAPGSLVQHELPEEGAPTAPALTPRSGWGGQWSTWWSTAKSWWGPGGDDQLE